MTTVYLIERAMVKVATDDSIFRVGEVTSRMYVSDQQPEHPPKGFIWCEGQAVSEYKDEHPELAQVYPNGLPDFRGRVLVGSDPAERR